MPEIDEIGKILEQVRNQAIRYFELAGKPLGVTGEIAEYEAARILKLKLADARQAGYDATKDQEKIQIKGRRITSDSKPGQRIGTTLVNTSNAMRWNSCEKIISAMNVL